MDAYMPADVCNACTHVRMERGGCIRIRYSPPDSPVTAPLPSYITTLHHLPPPSPYLAVEQRFLPGVFLLADERGRE